VQVGSCASQAHLDLGGPKIGAGEALGFAHSKLAGACSKPVVAQEEIGELTHGGGVAGVGYPGPGFAAIYCNHCGSAVEAEVDLAFREHLRLAQEDFHGRAAETRANLSVE